MGFGEIKEGDSMIEDPAEIAENFIAHLCSVGAELDLKIPHSNRSPLSYMEQSSITSFYADLVSDTEVELINGGLIVDPTFQTPFCVLYSRNMQD